MDDVAASQSRERLCVGLQILFAQKLLRLICEHHPAAKNAGRDTVQFLEGFIK